MSGGSGIGLEEIERAVREVMSRETTPVLAAYVFGSRARGTERADSDVDIGLLLPESPTTLAERFGLESRLEARIRRTVQTVILNDAPPDLVHRVLRDGKLVFETDTAARVRFEVAARNAYFDVLPTLERYREMRSVDGVGS